MNSDSHSDDRPGRVLLDWEQFEAVFQLTVQMSWLPHERLSDYKLAQSEVDRLVDIVRGLRRSSGASNHVRFDVVDAEQAGWLAGSLLATRLEERDLGVVAVAVLPARVISEWASALEYVSSSWLGDRELFLRTGFHLSEAREAIDLLRRS
jgi:hypothetical protein